MLAGEMREHLKNVIIPFWEGLKDNAEGGYYGWVGYDLKVDEKAVKGCILNSRILWFFSNAYKIFKDEKLLEDARHAYEFMKKYCMDKKYGGIYWSIRYDGEPEETIKHTYNQAFAIYALSSYYDAGGDKEALDMAFELFRIIEEKCTDEVGYRECFSRAFLEIENDKLSENGVIADKTMNTLLHVLEAYTELYRVSGDARVGEKLKRILDTFADKVYNPPLHRQEVFFDAQMDTILDLHSYGHDIETAWLVDRALEVLEDEGYTRKLRPITKDLTAQIYKTAFDGHSLANECEKGVVDETRVWWVQAETVVGFLNGYEKDSSKTEYLDAAKSVWEFIKEYVVDQRDGSEWYWKVDKEGKPIGEEPIVEPWKCPYHNGRMCFEVIRRSENVPEFA